MQLFVGFALQVHPDDIGFVGEQAGQIIPAETFFNLVGALPVNEDLHPHGLYKERAANQQFERRLQISRFERKIAFKMPEAFAEPTIRVSNVTKRFGDFTAVKDLSFDVHAGRVFGFLGPNGAGKTTTIRMIVGITAPDEGAITLKGEKISHKLQNRIGYLPEERGLYKKMRVVDQLRYFAALKGVERSEADKRIDRWLGRMQLSEWKLKKTTDLSKGMQQKVQFIATVLHDPDVLILDEPFSGLDPINVEFLIGVIDEYRTADKTIIFSTHLMSTAEKLCKDIILINKAEKVLGGSLREIKESYGKNLVAIRGSNFDGVLADASIVTRSMHNADEVEVELAQGLESGVLLKRLVESRANITKFEEIEPSLNDIFIDKVKEADA